MSEGQTDNPPPARKLLLATLGAAAAATALVVLVVLPAEFGRDPTGFGRLTGLSSLAPAHGHEAEPAASADATAARSYDKPFRTDLIEVPLVAKGDRAGYFELEYKVAMKAGQSFVYSWEVDGAEGSQLYADLHAETPKPEARVIEFRQEDALKSHGSIVAPADGDYGWYWLNKSTGPVTVRLRLSGFYELIPAGAPGNKAGLMPSLPQDATQ